MKEQRKATDYSDFELTTHGAMLYALVQSGICNYPHNAVVMQFFETVGRYGDFFKVRKECVVPALQAMVDERYAALLILISMTAEMLIYYYCAVDSIARLRNHEHESSTCSTSS